MYMKRLTHRASTPLSMYGLTALTIGLLAWPWGVGKVCCCEEGAAQVATEETHGQVGRQATSNAHDHDAHGHAPAAHRRTARDDHPILRGPGEDACPSWPSPEIGVYTTSPAVHHGELHGGLQMALAADPDDEPVRRAQWWGWPNAPPTGSKIPAYILFEVLLT